MDKNSAEEGHYNNIVYKRLAGEISLEDAAKPCDTTCRVDVTQCNNWEICLKAARSLVQCSTDFYFWQWLQAQKIVRNFYARVSYTRKFLSCNLCCKNIVRQLAQKIAQCDTGFTTYNHHRQCLSILPPLVHGQYLLAQEMLPAQSHGPLWNLLQATSLEWTWTPSSWNNNNNYYYCYLVFSD